MTSHRPGPPAPHLAPLRGHLATAILALTLSATQLDAQALRFTRPDCRVWESRFENPLSDSHGWRMPRVAWHATFAATSKVSELALRKVGAPKWIARLIPSVGIGLVPHLRWQLRYGGTIDPLDWTFDLNNRSLPMYGSNWKMWAVTYAATACFGSP